MASKNEWIGRNGYGRRQVSAAKRRDVKRSVARATRRAVRRDVENAPAVVRKGWAS